jgi:hypothetical protein
VGRNRDGLASVNNIGTTLEGLHEAAECDIEHRTHQQRQSPACKLIVQIEPDVAAAVRARLKCPSGSQLTQRSIRRPDQNASISAIERNTAYEGFTIDPACDRHVGHQYLNPSVRFPGPNGMSLAERHEFRIAFNVGHEVEHLVCAVMDPPHRPKNRHFFLRRSILPLRQEMANGETASGNRASDIDLYQLLFERDYAFGAVGKTPTATLIRARRSQLMQVNIGGAYLRQTVFDEGLTRSMNRVRGGMSAWI